MTFEDKCEVLTRFALYETLNNYKALMRVSGLDYSAYANVMFRPDLNPPEAELLWKHLLVMALKGQLTISYAPKKLKG